MEREGGGEGGREGCGEGCGREIDERGGGEIKVERWR